MSEQLNSLWHKIGDVELICNIDDWIKTRKSHSMGEKSPLEILEIISHDIKGFKDKRF